MKRVILEIQRRIYTNKLSFDANDFLSSKKNIFNADGETWEDISVCLKSVIKSIVMINVKQ